MKKAQQKIKCYLSKLFGHVIFEKSLFFSNDSLYKDVYGVVS